MKLIKSCLIAISMYSKLPVPSFEWKEENMKYSMAFFPLVGLLVGAAQLLLFALAGVLQLPMGFYAAFATVLPVILTGGIHVDGLIDTTDALASYQPMERRLEILKDSHAGAFAIIWAIVYFLMYYGGCQMMMNMVTVAMVAIGYVLSRAMSGLAAVTFPSARKNGTLATFSEAADKNRVRMILIMVILAALAVEFILCWQVGILVLLACGTVFYCYHRMALKNFGGITGDLAGWFLQICELTILLVVVLSRHGMNLIG